MNRDRTAQLRLDGITKTFGALTALSNVSLTLGSGEILGLVGDNGAGKSTLVKILSGIHPPTRGSIFINEERVSIRNPSDAISLGIETVQQSFGGLVNLMSIERNVFMGREPIKRILGGVLRMIDEARMQAETRELLDKIGITISSTKREIGYLSGGQRQAVAIARGIYFNAKLLILDEPTAALGVKETNTLLGIIGDLKKYLSVILIDHNLDHIFRIADHIVVLYQGRKVGDKSVGATDKQEIEMLMSEPSNTVVYDEANGQ